MRVKPTSKGIAIRVLRQKSEKFIMRILFNSNSIPHQMVTRAACPLGNELSAKDSSGRGDSILCLRKKVTFKMKKMLMVVRIIVAQLRL